MALQSLSSKQALPSKFILHDFTQNWSKLGISGSNCLGNQNCLVVRVQMMGLCHERNGLYSKIYVLGCSHISFTFMKQMGRMEG